MGRLSRLAVAAVLKPAANPAWMLINSGKCPPRSCREPAAGQPKASRLTRIGIGAAAETIALIHLNSEDSCFLRLVKLSFIGGEAETNCCSSPQFGDVEFPEEPGVRGSCFKLSLRSGGAPCVLVGVLV